MMSDRPQRSIHNLSSFTRWTYFLGGILLTAWAFCSLLLTNEILTGGLPGLSLILFHKLGWPLAITQWSIAIIIFIPAYFSLNKQSLASSILGAILLPAAIALFLRFPDLNLPMKQPLLAALAGGFMLGLGLGFIFKANASVGGFSLIARMLNKWTSLTIANAMMLLDGCIITISITLFSFEEAILALLTLYIMTKAISLVQTGFSSAKSVTIITTKPDKIKNILYERIDCGLTQLEASGGYSGQEKAVLVCVIPVSKLARLKRNVIATDPEAFTIIQDASEVMGYGFV